MMSLWIDQKYIGLISNRLDRFRQKGQGLYNFRCPVCGDSKKNKTKARGWFLNKDGKYRFYCHNCSASMSFPNFLKSLDVVMHQEYMRDVFLENNFVNPKPISKPDVTKIERPQYRYDSPLKSLTKVSSLPADHPVKKYVMSRKIPSNVQYKLFFCPKFKEWVNSFLPDKFPDIEKDESRLILPFIDRDKNFFGCTGRSLSKTSSIRYITILSDENKPKVFGLDSVNFDKTVYVFEGPIDSMFIPNSIAMCGSDLSAELSIDKNRCIVVFDNEPRSPQTVKKIDKYIEFGYKVCFWPERIKGKDVNEMVLNGHDPDEIKIIIEKNSYSGIEAKLQLQMWRKC
jgi:hypothetical protein